MTRTLLTVIAIAWWPMLLTGAVITVIVGATLIFEAADRYGRRVAETARRNLEQARR